MMLLRQQLRRLTVLTGRHIVRYSTISTQGTVSSSRPINVTPIFTPPVKNTTQQENPKPTQQLEIENPLVHLERARSLFANEHGLFDKIDVISRTLRNPDTPIRVGLIGSSPSLLNTILADPFASDQSWHQALTERSTEVTNIIKFSPAFESSNNEYNIPSPFLKSLGKTLEFVELSSKDTAGNDGCHIYISFQANTPFSLSKWPVYQVSDIATEDVHDIVLSKSEISSQVAYQAVKLLTESPKNATIYTDIYTRSNMTQFTKLLNKITNLENVIPRLYTSILKNLSEQNQTHSLTLDELNSRDAKVKKYISNWDQASHSEFQNVFKPYVVEYEKRELPWWKLYSRVDDIQGIFAHMLNLGLLNDSFKNYSYVKGQIDSFTSFQTGNVLDFDDLKKLEQKNELSTLKRMVIQNDLVTLQNKAGKLLMTNFLGIQLPLLLLSIPGFVIYDFSLYSMAGLASLGAVVGFNNVSKNWLKLVDQFKQDLFEKVRLALLDVNKSLYDDWSAKYEEEKEMIMKRMRLIEALKNDLGM